VATGTLSPVPKQYFQDVNGNPLAGARLYTWLAGTTTPTPVYTDVDLTVPHSNPAIADGSGRLTFYLAPTSYKVELRDAQDVSVWIVDPVPAVPTLQINQDITITAGEDIVERDTVYLSDGAGALTAGRWYKTDADNPYSSNTAGIIGIVLDAVIGAAETGRVRIQGRIEGYSALSAGATYYVSATAGGLTNTPPANARVVGIAESSTVLLLTPSTTSATGLAVFTKVQVTSAAADALVIGGGIQAGSGLVQIVGTDGRIPSISSTTFASLSGALLTGIPETAIVNGALLARVSDNETITGQWGFTGPTTYMSGQASDAIALQLRGRASDSAAILQFATSGGTAQSANLAVGATGRMTVAASSVEVAEAGVAHDTAQYGTFGITRSATAGDAAYLALTKVGTAVYAIGITATNRLLFGQAAGGQLLSQGISTDAFNLFVPQTAYAATFSGSGASLTALNASELTSGTIPDGRFPGVLPSLNGGNLYNLNASALALGTVPSARISGAYPGITSVGTLTGSTSMTDLLVSNNATVSGTMVAGAFNGNGFNLHSLQEVNILDQNVFARITSNEVITGQWHFDPSGPNLTMFQGRPADGFGLALRADATNQIAGLQFTDAAYTVHRGQITSSADNGITILPGPGGPITFGPCTVPLAFTNPAGGHCFYIRGRSGDDLAGFYFTNNANNTVTSMIDVSPTTGLNLRPAGIANQVNVVGDLFPGTTAIYDVGSPTLYWDGIYFLQAVQIPSNLEYKDVRGETPLGLDFIRRLRPQAYHLRVGKNRTLRHGFIAEELEAALEGQEFAGLVKKDDLYGINYSELIAPLVKAVQELSARLELLEHA
jgi:Chaperone of endosialidase